MAYGRISKAATYKYRSKFDIIQVRVEQGKREKIAKHAKKSGESMNTFINRAIKETIKNDMK